MRDLSLHVLDIAQNSVSAGATFIEIAVNVDTAADSIIIEIKDNGCGMTAEQLKKVRDPFFTTRTTRKVGMGIPLFRMAAEMTGGKLELQSEISAGTTVTASFVRSHIDCLPLGDMCGTITALIRLNPELDFRYTYTVNGKSFLLDTREIRRVLEDVPLNSPDVAVWIDQYIRQHMGLLTGS